MRTLTKLYLLTIAVLVLGLCLIPRLVFRIKYDDPPLPVEKYLNSHATVTDGMTMEDVRAVLGNPHEKTPNFMYEGDEAWFYYTDSLGWNYLGIRFGPDKRVASQWIP